MTRTIRCLLTAMAAGIIVPAVALAQFPSAEAAKAQADAAQRQGAAQATAAKQEGTAKATAAQKDAGTKADTARADATTAAGGAREKVKKTAKDTGKSGVAKGSQKASLKVKPVVGDEKARAVEATATEKGGVGVDRGVDKAAEKVEGVLK